MTKKFISLYISTRRTAQLANVEPHVILMRLQRDGAFKGIKPRKAENGHWVWPAADVYKALGLFPDSRRPDAQGLQDRAIEATGADVLAAHLVVDWLHQTSRPALTRRERTDEMFADVRDQVALVAACRARAGCALNDEDEMTPDDWAKANALASSLESELLSLVGYLRWRSPVSAQRGAK